MSKMVNVLPSLSEAGITSEIGQKNIVLPAGGTTGGMVTTGSQLSKIPMDKGRYKGKAQLALEAKKPSLVVMFHWS
jgi:hypothetical protein